VNKRITEPADRAKNYQDRIPQHYRQTGNGEPDTRRWILYPNGRLGDLLLSVSQKETARDKKQLQPSEKSISFMCMVLAVRRRNFYKVGYRGDSMALMNEVMQGRPCGA